MAYRVAHGVTDHEVRIRLRNNCLIIHRSLFQRVARIFHKPPERLTVFQPKLLEHRCFEDFLCSLAPR